jgi:hypothetical protein
MTLHGVDVYIWSESKPGIPDNLGAFTLKLISNRGTKVYPGPVPDMEMNDWFRCRYFSETEVTNAQIEEVLNHVTSLGLTWTKAQKLFRIDGVDAFSQPY